VVSKKWWRPFGYDYVLLVIHAKQERYLFILMLCFDLEVLTLLLLSLRPR
jgi:hypothetical protein